jgi:hypothetical protein
MAKKRRLRGGGRKPAAAGLEEELYQFFKQEYEVKKNPVSRKLLVRKAREIDIRAPTLTGLNFSKGWLDRFLKRHHIVLRRTTTVCQKPPADYVEKLVRFILYVRKVCIDNGLTADQILACDETAVWIDPSSSTTLAPCGSRDVPVSSAGHSKLRITALLTASSSGVKYRPYVLLNRKRQIREINDRFGRQLCIVWAGKIWMDDSLTASYLQQVIGPQHFSKKLPIWVSYRCHISKETKRKLTSLKVLSAVVPGGCTKFIQPADVSWNKPFKEKIQEFHDDWLRRDDLPLTASGNLKPPSIDVYLQWIVDSWGSLSSELIIRSFQVCGINLPPNGSEDDIIHCFKADGPCPEGRELLRSKMAEMNAETEPLSEDADSTYATEQEYDSSESESGQDT